MGLLDRFRRPDPAAARASTQFATARIDLTQRPTSRSLMRPQAWQADAWTVYENLGEAGFIIDFFGHAMSRVRLFPAAIEDPEQGPVPLDEVAGIPAELAARADLELARVRHQQHGQGEILRQMAVNLKTPGEAHLCAWNDVDGVESWQVASTDSLAVINRAYVVRRWPGDRDGHVMTDQDFMWRFWRQSARWPGLATSEMRRILSHAEGLQLVERSLRNASRSRIAGAGMVLFPTEANLGGTRGQGGGIIEGGDFIKDWIAAATAPIADEGAVSAFMPLPVEIPGDWLDKVKHIDFARVMTEVEERREKQLLVRIAQGLDAPPELMSGMADVNHWNAFQIQDSTYQAHLEPLAYLIADIIAAAVIRPALLGAGYPGPMVDRVMVGVDPSDLLARPNRPQDAKDAHEKMVISDETLRKELKFTDADAPTDDEKLLRMVMGWRTISTGAVDIARQILSGATDGSVVDATAPAAAPAAAVAASAALVAGGQIDDLGPALAAIDVRLADRLQVACDAAVNRAVERAANRMRSRTRRGDLAARLKDVPSDEVFRALGRAVATELGVGPDQAVTADDFAPLADSWDSWVGAAQADALNLVDSTVGLAPEQRTSIEGGQAADRDAGWAVLLGALLVLTQARIFDPEIPAEPNGETSLLSVPAGTIRESLAVAGGGTGQVTAGGAMLVDAGTRVAGGVATGERLFEVTNQYGATLNGWSWLHGSSSRVFEPHLALSGVVFASWQDPALANELGAWPYETHFFPGDHKGCSCWSAPNWVIDPNRQN